MHRPDPSQIPTPVGSGPVPPRPPRRFANAYARRDDGTWVYDDGSDDPVPGARDLFRSELLGVTRDDDHAFVTTPSLHLDAPLRRWVVDVLRLEEVATCAGHGYRVPAVTWDQLDGPVGMAAPELHVHAMLSLQDVAELTGLTESTLRVYRGRGTMVEPQRTVSRTPLWARPVVTRWVASRTRRRAPA